MDAEPLTLQRTILHYPSMVVTDSAWLRQALLYWDKICSIAPESVQESDQIDYTPELLYLEDNELFSFVSPAAVISDHDIAPQFYKEFKSLIMSPRFRRMVPPQNHREFNSGIHVDKLNGRSMDLLISQHLAQEVQSPYKEWVPVEHLTYLLYMSLLAKYLAEVDLGIMVPGTANRAYEGLVFKEQASSTARSCLSLRFRSVLPAPSPNVTISEIVKFKRKRRDDLLRFRSELDEFQDNLSKCASRVEIRECNVRFKERLEKGVSDLEHVLRDSRIATITSMASTLINLKSPTTWLSAATAIGTIPVGSGVIAIGITGVVETAKVLIDKGLERRAAERQSAFAYLYQAKRAGIFRE